MRLARAAPRAAASRWPRRRSTASSASGKPAPRSLLSCFQVAHLAPGATFVVEGQQFGEARVAAHDVDHAIGAAREVEQRELGLGRVGAGEPAHRLVRAEAGRAQHQQPVARQRAHAPPGLRAGAAVGDHRARHQAAHRVRHQVHRLARALGLGQQASSRSASCCAACAPSAASRGRSRRGACASGAR